MFCPACGTRAAGAAKYCVKCGGQLPDASGGGGPEVISPPASAPASAPPARRSRGCLWIGIPIVLIVIGFFAVVMILDDIRLRPATVVEHSIDEPSTKAFELQQMRGQTGGTTESAEQTGGEGTGSGEPTMKR